MTDDKISDHNLQPRHVRATDEIFNSIGFLHTALREIVLINQGLGIGLSQDMAMRYIDGAIQHLEEAKKHLIDQRKVK
jgi:hypothetical protein